MKRGMTIEYLMCRDANLNFEVDFGVNGVIGTIVTKWDLIASFSSIIKINTKNTLHSPLSKLIDIRDGHKECDGLTCDDIIAFILDMCTKILFVLYIVFQYSYIVINTCTILILHNCITMCE